ncbi:hypothetical protein Q5752_000674 [Cryptotrichosporon argae]
MPQNTKSKEPKPPKREFIIHDNKPQTAHIESVGPVRRVSVDDDYVLDEKAVRVEGEEQLTGFLVLTILAAALAGFLFGYDTGVVGVALPLVGNDLGSALSATQEEVITACTTIGAIFGGAILGGYGDRLGRKRSLFVSDVCFTIGAILIASSYSIAQIVVGRLVLGLGVGGAAVTAPMYITELAPTSIRGRCLGTNAFFIPFGQVVASAIGAGVQDVDKAWRILFALGIVPSAIQIIIMHWLPESPRVNVLRDQDDRARKTLARIYPKATPDQVESKLRVLRNTVEASTQMQHRLTFKDRMRKLWQHKPYRRAILLVGAFNAFGQLTGFNTLVYYSSTLFGLVGFTNPALAGLVPTGINALFVLIGMLLSDRVGRRRLMFIGLPFMVVGLIWASVSVQYMTASTGHLLVSGADYNRNLAGSLIGAVACFVVGYGISYSHLPWYMSELLVIEIRAFGSAFATTSNWLANLVVSTSYLSELSAITPMGTFLLYLGFVTVGGIFVFFCYPETRGISVDDVGLLFEDGFGVRRSEQIRASKTVPQRRFDDLEAGGAGKTGTGKKGSNVSDTDSTTTVHID